MSYATLEELIDRAGMDEIVQVADRDGDLIPDPAVVGAALKHAENLVNGYLVERYPLPFAAVPDLVRTWSVSIARYYLHREGPPDYVLADYRDALAGLKDAQRGVISLPVVGGADPVTAPMGEALFDAPPQVFTPEFLRGWR